MRILVISDIHANLTAFEAVLEDADGEWDALWCLGDVIGYGPDPNECTELLRSHDPLSLTGNHDWAVLGKLDANAFNHEARSALLWTREVLSQEARDYLEPLPPSTVEEPFTLAHGSPRQPIWEYILDEMTAQVNFGYLETPFCFVGHTHTPVVYEQTSRGVRAHRPRYGEPLSLPDHRYIINPGSVGQPRDSDPRAAYGLLDTEAMTWEHRRTEYHIEATQQRMEEHGLPYRLIARLELGW
jgi:predicted phosphodiesterase